MTKYIIKNPEIETALRGLFRTQKDFEDFFNETCEREYHNVVNDDDEIVFEIPGSLHVFRGYRIDIPIAKFMIEEIIEYDPKVWNDGKQVEPSKEGLYRVEFLVLSGEYKECWLWKNGEWCTQLENPIRDLIDLGLIRYLRFKPWDDEE